MNNEDLLYEKPTKPVFALKKTSSNVLIFEYSDFSICLDLTKLRMCLVRAVALVLFR